MVVLESITMETCEGTQPVAGDAHLDSSMHRSHEWERNGDDVLVRHASQASAGILSMEE